MKMLFQPRSVALVDLEAYGVAGRVHGVLDHGGALGCMALSRALACAGHCPRSHGCAFKCRGDRGELCRHACEYGA